MPPLGFSDDISFCLCGVGVGMSIPTYGTDFVITETAGEYEGKLLFQSVIKRRLKTRVAGFAKTSETVFTKTNETGFRSNK